MWDKFLFALTFAGATCVHGVRGGPGPVVDVGYARYRGNLTFPDSVAYLGIPYAEPPLGDRRFRAPLPLNTTRIQSSTGGEVVDATQYPEFCVQGSTGQGDAGGAGSEDCLRVNIYAPFNATKNSKLPVLVYIHGGGYVYGNPRNWPFDHWIHQDQHVVVVSVYYRLDSFGFLATSAFSDSVNGDLNAGFLDQREALRWVQKHVMAFGGDPKQVTINGQSAGGSSVELHLVANHGQEQLFARAIAQSVDREVVPIPEKQESFFDFFATAAGCPSSPVGDRLACLRAAPVSALARAQDNASSASGAGPYSKFRPVLDGKIFTEHPTQAILRGAFRQVPLIVGATSNESLSSLVDLQASLKALYPALTNATLAKFESVYNVSDFLNGTERNRVATGESGLICAVRDCCLSCRAPVSMIDGNILQRNILGQEWVRKGNVVFTYRYNQPNPTSGGGSLVQHAAENWMMFLGTDTGFNGTTVFTGLNPTETAFAEELIAYWLSFVRSGDPNTFKLARSPEWKRYEVNQKNRIVLQQGRNGTTATIGSFAEIEPQAETTRCGFVASIANQEEN